MGTTMANETIFIQTNDEKIELKGQELTNFLAQRAKDQAELDKAQAKIDETKAAKDSAMSKLKALGLNEDEIYAILGVAKPELDEVKTI